MLQTKTAPAGARTRDKWEIWLSITDADGVVHERIDLTEYNLEKPLAQASLIETITNAAREANLANIERGRK